MTTRELEESLQAVMDRVASLEAERPAACPTCKGQKGLKRMLYSTPPREVLEPCKDCGGTGRNWPVMEGKP
jgi:DnaJ-class molecular chaperone